MYPIRKILLDNEVWDRPERRRLYNSFRKHLGKDNLQLSGNTLYILFADEMDAEEGILALTNHVRKIEKELKYKNI